MDTARCSYGVDLPLLGFFLSLVLLPSLETESKLSVATFLTISYSFTFAIQYLLSLLQMARKIWRLSFQIWKYFRVAEEGGFVLVAAGAVEEFGERDKMYF